MAVPAGAVYIGGVACTPDGAVYVTPTGTAAITGGNTAILLGRVTIPFIVAPTGTMANNGAITLGTALGRVYAKCYMLLPAGAIAAGVPAAATWYYTEMSSTTVGAVFNNTYTSGLPTTPASKTAFATTGPGAYTGVTVETTGPSFTLPALGPDSVLQVWGYWVYSNSAGSKFFKTKIGATAMYGTATRNTNLSSAMNLVIMNQGATNSQFAYATETTGAGSATGGSNTGAENTGVASTVNGSLNILTATDYLVLEQMIIVLYTDGL